jgi:transcription initiation factor TFIID subunit 8
MAEDFARHVARVVAAQIAEATGFDACQDSAVEILGDLLRRYLSTLSTSSHSYAELAGRSQSNLADVMLALEDLGVTPEDLHQHMQFRVRLPEGAGRVWQLRACSRSTVTGGPSFT